MQDYIEFLQSKIKRVYEVGFDVDPETLNKNLFGLIDAGLAKEITNQ